MIKLIKFILIALLANSCISKKGTEYANDFNNMEDTVFKEKYFESEITDKYSYKNIKYGEAYFVYDNNFTFQIIVFSENKFIYKSQLMANETRSNFPVQKLFRGSTFSVNGNTLKIKSMARTPGNTYLVVEEGIIKNDTIYINKQYNAHGIRNKEILSKEIYLAPDIKVVNFENNYYVEKIN
ncbi:hypothetical protein [Flavobacterium subsaxonicum]|uniref:Uncharacterized protein n=1 Tax=Flavobacterium subsaxonicum WB 4.1-42 = DSM 21790 TaxID=1121898 RepID=A0A0A2MVH2_9FLAO|nr:hypothetical protein [Flavobacterium subsaxonicum]KGO92195.1 hypothetical protein Q766_13615 [Flavobacterium subsaxonicum WB 4.1-42 = DSM 21790]